MRATSANRALRRNPLVILSALAIAVAVLPVMPAAAADPPVVDFTLTILHNNDGESQVINAGSGLEDYGGAARFKAVVDRERSTAATDGVVMVSSGDNFLAGPEFNASLDHGIPFYDTIAMELIGYDAVNLGNHDFDFGPDVLADFLAGYTVSPPYVSANLDFSGEPSLAALVGSQIFPSTIVTAGGEQIGIIGALTTNISFISSPRNVIANAVAAAVQAEIDALEAAGVDKIILSSHLQGISEEIALAALLDGVDVIIAGGGDELLLNGGELTLPGDDVGDAWGTYPVIATDLNGAPVPVVTTPGEYRYVGELSVAFDADGNVIMGETMGGLVRVTANVADPDAVVPDAAMQTQVVDPVATYLAALESTVIATSEVGLDGQRNSVRFFETNEGNLIADSQLWYGRSVAGDFGVDMPQVAFQNGGGIRNNTIIPAGDITILDTFDMAPFANFVSIVEDVPIAQFVEILENAVSRVDSGEGTGRFAQVAGVSFVYDSQRTAMDIANDETVLVPGERIISAVLDDGTVIVEDGAIAPTAPASIDVITSDFLANGGDQYPFRGLPYQILGATYQQALQYYIEAPVGDGGLEGLISDAQYREGGEGRITDAAIVINEFVANHTGTDTHEYLEVKGAPDYDYSDYTLLEIEGDSGGSLGVIDGAWTVGTTDGEGHWVTPFLSNEIENGTVTFLLVRGFTGAVGEDLDTDDDGSIDYDPFTAIADGVAVNDGGAGDLTWATPVLADGFDGMAFSPGGASRIPDGFDSDAPGDWMRNDFDGGGLPGFAGTLMAGEAVNTPGAGNLAFALTSIYDIQYTEEPSGDSPLTGETVVTEGIVTAVFDDASVVIIQDGEGPWNGLYLYSPDVYPAVGDHVYAAGPISEYYGLTEIAYPEITIWSSDNPLPGPVVLTTAEMSAEPWESVLVRTETVTVTDPDLGFGEWLIDDGSGPVVVDDMGFYTYVPALDDVLEFVQGPLTYGFGAFKIEPRSDDDIQMASPVTHTIHEIQFTEDPSGDSPLNGEFVITEGIVTAVFDGSSVVFIQDGEGPWNGLYLYSPDIYPAVGDHVYAAGPISEYYGLTEMAYPEITIVSSGNPLPGAMALDTSAIPDEPWESVLVRATNVTVTDPDLGFGEWLIDDGSGPVVVDDMGFYTYIPMFDDELSFVQGPLTYSFGAFKIEPRGDGDILEAGTTPVLINEVDADTPDTDVAEFVELFDGGLGSLPLDGLTVVFFNGNGDVSYAAYDLDGYATDEDGFFVLGNAGVPGVDLVFPDNGLQNGADAVALYFADAADFESGTPVTTEGLVDALVYDTDDADDEGLLVLLNPGEPQVNERGGGDGTAHANARCPDGAGGARNTSTYTQIPPTPGAPNDCEAAPQVCGDPSTPVYAIQGSGDASPLVGSLVAVEAVVTALFPDLSGFYVQDPVGDGDPATSDGIFIYDPGGSSVAVGDLVRVAGPVSEYQTLTEITAQAVLTCDTGFAIAPTMVTLPRPEGIEWERYEGMLVAFDTLTVTETYNLGSDGEIMLSAPDRLWNPTDVVDPGTPANDLQAANDRSYVVLNDGSGVKNPVPIPYLDMTDPVRLGDTVSGLAGVIDGFQSSYTLQPTSPVAFDRAVPRPDGPDGLGDGLKVASFNLYNYWNTLGGRGAATADELAKQEAKLVAAIAGFDADVIGLQELENNGDGPDSAIARLVDILNAAGIGPWDYVRDPAYSLYPDGILSTNPIKVGIIYRTDRVAPIGDPMISEDPSFATARPPFGQVFEFDGSAFGFISNHFKSKGCDGATGLDLDQGDGQSCFNALRTEQALATLAFIADIQVASGSDHVVMVGDLNSYGLEDPAVTLRDGGLVDLTLDLAGPDRYSYVYLGMAGQLDYVFATPSMAEAMTGVDIWHINADEPRAMGYNVFDDYHNPDPYRSSDHDPVMATFVMADTTPPECFAELEPLLMSYRIGMYLVHFGCTDDTDPAPEVNAYLNGYPVYEGQRVLLMTKLFGPMQIFERPQYLLVRAATFELLVEGTDMYGNTGFATAAPMFRPPRPYWIE